MVYEGSLKARETEKGESKKKIIALTSNDMESESEGSDDDMAMLVKNFKKFMRNKKRGLSKGMNKFKDRKEDNHGQYKQSREHGEKRKDDEPTYYKCGNEFSA